MWKDWPSVASYCQCFVGLLASSLVNWHTHAEEALRLLWRWRQQTAPKRLEQITGQHGATSQHAVLCATPIAVFRYVAPCVCVRGAPQRRPHVTFIPRSFLNKYKSYAFEGNHCLHLQFSKCRNDRSNKFAETSVRTDYMAWWQNDRTYVITFISDVFKFSRSISNEDIVT